MIRRGKRRLGKAESQLHLGRGKGNSLGLWDYPLAIDAGGSQDMDERLAVPGEHLELGSNWAMFTWEDLIFPSLLDWDIWKIAKGSSRRGIKISQEYRCLCS